MGGCPATECGLVARGADVPDAGHRPLETGWGLSLLRWVQPFNLLLLRMISWGCDFALDSRMLR
jgi:hypothetical protein